MTYKPTQLSAEAFEELRTIARSEISKAMSDEEIENMGINLLRLFAILVTPKPTNVTIMPDEQELKAVQFIQEEVNHGRSPSIRDLSRAMGFLSSRSGFRMLNTLIRKGWVYREKGGRLRLLPEGKPGGTLTTRKDVV